MFAMAAAVPARAGALPPVRLTFGGTYRIRYETLDGRFRKKAAGSDQILVERLLLAARVQTGGFYLGGELEDLRQQLADRGTHLGTDSVDTFEPLQAYLGYTTRNAFVAGDSLDVMAGRMSFDEGRRRLVARNRYRNTLNAFTGIRARWHSAEGTSIEAFFVLPVNRAPSSFPSLIDNATRLDSESWHTRFWGVFVSHPKLIGRATGQAYLYGLHAEDGPNQQVADRDLYTPGVRLVAGPMAGAWDYEFDAAMQFGTSRATKSPSDRRDLTHLAGFVHAETGYSWAAPWSPRFSVEFDYASGDENPNDGTDNRFDTLYGARHFDFGPTGLYGAVARSNIETPGLRLELKPRSGISVMTGYRLLWLASARDAWTTAGLSDPSGASGRYLGEQLEARLRVEAIPKRLRLEVGGAVLTHGEFQQRAAGAPAAANTTYAYATALLSF